MLFGLVTTAALAVGAPISKALAQTRTGTDLTLVNGKFVDGRESSVPASPYGMDESLLLDAAYRWRRMLPTMDLGGRTVIPGFVDAHAHYTRAGINPGHEARRIERAFSIAELQDAIARRASSVAPGEFITCIGGWNHTQLAESRRPTKAELDDAAPKHPVYISGTGGGTGAITNSLARRSSHQKESLWMRQTEWLPTQMPH
jgi:hypothetical protein